MKKLIASTTIALSLLGLGAVSGCTQTFIGEYTANPASGEVWYLRYTAKKWPWGTTIVAQDLIYCAPSTGPEPQQCARADMSAAGVKAGGAKKK
jgi:hypothetical protein